MFAVGLSWVGLGRIGSGVSTSVVSWVGLGL